MKDDKSLGEEELGAARFYAYHIQNPCVCPITGKDIRYFYIEEARRATERFKTMAARGLLLSVISIYTEDSIS